MERTLVLMRHAKSAWPVGVRDVERPLNARGTRAAPAAGNWVNARTGTLDRVFVSTATRTEQTWVLAHNGGLSGSEVMFEPRVYAASWWDLLDLVREQPTQATSVLLLGHNPGMEDLAEELAGSGDPRALRELRAKFPTSGAAILTSDKDWAEWGSGCAQLTAFYLPRH